MKEAKWDLKPEPIYKTKSRIWEFILNYLLGISFLLAKQ
jgi:hypothetical protein